VLQRFSDRVVRAELCIEVAEDADADDMAHAVIVLNLLPKSGR
jgi:hypothetical protein